MALKRIRLEMARNHAFPEGSSRHGYLLTAPLRADGRIDPDAYHGYKGQCRVTRFWGDDGDEAGHLVRKPGGAWAFHYDIMGDADDDENGYRFGDHAFVPGNYVSIKDHEGELWTFKVASVTGV